MLGSLYDAVLCSAFALGDRNHIQPVKTCNTYPQRLSSRINQRGHILLNQELGKLTQQPRHDDSTINTLLALVLLGYVTVDKAYCYRWSSVVCWSICHDREPAKIAEPIRCRLGCGLRWA